MPFVRNGGTPSALVANANLIGHALSAIVSLALIASFLFSRGTVAASKATTRLAKTSYEAEGKTIPRPWASISTPTV
jgi:hypothetical protein